MAKEGVNKADAGQPKGSLTEECISSRNLNRMVSCTAERDHMRLVHKPTRSICAQRCEPACTTLRSPLKEPWFLAHFPETHQKGAYAPHTTSPLASRTPAGRSRNRVQAHSTCM